MTNEEAKKADKELKALLNMCDPSPLTKELEDALKMAIKALDQEDVLGKIREEVEAYQADAFYPNDVMMHKRTVLQIIDKYREGGADDGRE